jgi:hypothetical protein
LNVTFADGALERQRVSARSDRANVAQHDHRGMHRIYDRRDTTSERDHGR